MLNSEDTQAIEKESTAGDITTRRMIRTAAGLLGPVPRETRDGDKIVLIAGATIPFVLRPKGIRWRLVGDSYVHGVMFGEAWNEAKLETLWIE